MDPNIGLKRNVMDFVRKGLMTHCLSQDMVKGSTKLVKEDVVAFKTGEYKQQVIFIGGLTDGFLATDDNDGFGNPDAESWELHEELNIDLKVFSHEEQDIQGETKNCPYDAMELDQLISHLINKEDSEGVILLGHSTGCQDIVYYMRTNTACSRAVRGAILQLCHNAGTNDAFQAPVSDREYRATLPETASMIDLATAMIKEGREIDLMPREANPDAPITAYRFEPSDLKKEGSVGPAEDKISWAAAKLAGVIFMGIHCHLLFFCFRELQWQWDNSSLNVIFSMADEYVPEYVDKKALVERLCKAMGGAQKVEIEYGNHSLSNRVNEAVEVIMDFLKSDGPAGWDDPWS
ncbi:hypothetical protein ACLOJK_025945 [Asimina triloba]